MPRAKEHPAMRLQVFASIAPAGMVLKNRTSLITSPAEIKIYRIAVSGWVLHELPWREFTAVGKYTVLHYLTGCGSFRYQVIKEVVRGDVFAIIAIAVIVYDLFWRVSSAILVCRPSRGNRA